MMQLPIQVQFKQNSHQDETKRISSEKKTFRKQQAYSSSSVRTFCSLFNCMQQLVKKPPHVVAGLQMKRELAARLYGEGVPYLPLPSVKRAFDVPQPVQRPVTSKVSAGVRYLRHAQSHNRKVSMSPFRKRMQELNATVIEGPTNQFITPSGDQIPHRPLDNLANTSYGAFAELNVSDIKPYAQKTQYRSHVRQARESLYSTNRASITGVSVMSALKPRLNASMDRSNIYSMKTGTAQGQRRKFQKRSELENSRIGIPRQGAGLDNVPGLLSPQNPVENVCSRKVADKMRMVITAQSRRPTISLAEGSGIEETKEPTKALPWDDMDKFLEALLENRPEAVAKFMYFNLKGENPYDLEITDYANRCIERHYTISAKGVTRYDNDAAVELIPLKEWLIERELYRGIKNFSFFNSFHRWKLLNTWRKRVWSARKKQIIDDLEEKMFCLDPVYREHILRHQKYMCELSKLRLVEINKGSETDSLEDFVLRQKRKRREVGSKVKEYSTRSRENLRELIKRSLDKLRNRVLLEKSLDNDRGVSKVEGKLAHTSSANPALETIGFPENMNYGHRAALRRECSRFLRLAYLVDFLAIKSLGDVYLTTVRQVLDVLSHLDQNAQVEINTAQDILRKAAKAEPIILVTVQFDPGLKIPKDKIKETEIRPYNEKFCKPKDFDLSCHVELESEKKDDMNFAQPFKKLMKAEVPNIIDYWLNLSPDKEDLYEQLLKALGEGMRMLEKFERWSKHDELLPYANVLEEWDEIIGGDWDSPEQNFLIPADYIEKHPLYITHEQTLKNVIFSAYSKCYDFLKSFNKFLNIYWRNQNADLSLVFHDRVLKPAETLNNVLRLFEYQKKTFTEKIPETCNLGLLKINCEPTRKALLPVPGEYIGQIESLANATANTRLDDVKGWITEARRKLEVKIDTVEGYVRQRKAWNLIADAYQGNRDKIDVIGEVYDTLGLFGVQIKKDDKQKHTLILQEIVQLNQLLSNVSDQQELNLDKFKRQLQDQLVPSLEETLDSLKKEVEDEILLTHQEDVENVIARIDSLENRFMTCSEKCKEYNEYQKRLNLEMTEFEVAEVIKEGLVLRKSLWKSLKEWQALTHKWIAQQFTTINAKEIGSKAEEYCQIALKVDKELPENPVSKELKSMVDTFKKAVPIVAALRNELLKKTHWKSIKELLKAEFETTDPEFTLRSLLDLKAIDYQEEIQQISVQATQENKLEGQLALLEDEWKKCMLTVKQYKLKDAYVLNKVENIVNLLDQSLAIVDTILADKYVKPLLSQAEKWRQTLNTLQAIMEEWMLCQTQWIYFEEIFTTGDLRKQLLNEASKFEGVDKFFKGLMQKAIKSPNPLKLLKGYKGDLLEHLKHYNKISEEIKKLLLDYLENKRRDFPRFYFVSSDEMLDILSNPRHLEGIEKYLPKLFDSVAKVEVHEGTDMVAVLSQEQERLQFHRPTRIKENIESCLEQVQANVKEALLRLMKASITDYDEMEQKDWVHKYPAQVVLAMSQIVWCNATESAILEQSTNPNALIEWYEELIRIIQQFVELSKDASLSPALKKTVSAALISEVHSRDIIEELALSDVMHLGDYNWQKILRLYWEEEDVITQQPASILVKALSAKLEYGSEYIGPSSRLITTPLTDRVWVSIANAINSHMGVVLVGPKGIGKAETVKELAKTIAIHCVTMHCSESTNYRFISRAISGASQQGAWACLAGFEAVDSEVLSVVGKQLTELREAFKKGATTLLIDEREIPIKAGCGLFLTMNQPLDKSVPGNFKANFRTVAITKPDTERIIEVSLFVERFVQSKQLAKKIVKFSQLAQELLNVQSFDIKFLKNIVTAAITLKASTPSLDESSAVLVAINSMVAPTLNDLQTLNSILSDIFPSVPMQEPVNEPLVSTIGDALENSGFARIPSLVQKSAQLSCLLEACKGTMVIGSAGSGKSTVIKALHDAYNMSKSEEDSKISMMVLNPKALTLEELFGTSNPSTHEWTDGLVPKILRAEKEKVWIVFDGPVSIDWAEVLNSAIDSESVLSLGNSERIQLEPEIKILFESDSLRTASPGTVSRCGIVYLPDESINWQAYVEGWLNKAYPDSSSSMSAELKNHILFLFEQNIERGLNKLRNTCTVLIKTTDLQLIANVCNMLEAVLTPATFVGDKIEKKKILTQAYCFAFIWGIGGSLDESSREKMDLLVRGLFENVEISSTQSVFEYYLEPKKGMSFRPWNEIAPTFTYHEGQIAVPTVEAIRQSYLIEQLTRKCKNIYITGSPACGKSTIVKNAVSMANGIDSATLNFTSVTNAGIAQTAIEEKLQTKQSGLYGALPGKKMAVIVDDVHLPSADKSSSPIELLRQLLDRKGWYDRSKFYWKKIMDTSVICVGGTELPLRFTRHFNVVSIPMGGKANLEAVFKPLVSECMKSKGYPEALQGLAHDMVKEGVELYVELCEKFNAKCGKVMSTLTPRDLARGFEGLQMCTPTAVNSSESLAKLWVHEFSRVYMNKLAEETDKELISSIIMDHATKVFKIQVDPNLHWTFSITDSSTQAYEEIQDMTGFRKMLEEKLEEYRANTPAAPHIILFDGAIESLLKIVNTLRHPCGHSLLVGDSGTGKCTLTRLAAYLQGMELKELDLRKELTVDYFKTFLKETLKTAGILGKSICFLIHYLEILPDQALDMLNALLSNGEVPNLFTLQEMDKVLLDMRPIAVKLKRDESHGSLLSTFIERVRQNLKSVICTEQNDKFENIIKSFPALLKSCKIVRVSHWSQNSLQGITKKALAGLEGCPSELKATIKEICTEIHHSATNYAVEYNTCFNEIHIQPSHFIDVLRQFGALFNNKKKEYSKRKGKVFAGLEELTNYKEKNGDSVKSETELQQLLKEKGDMLEQARKQVLEEQKVVNEKDKAVAMQAQEVGEKSKIAKVAAEEMDAELNAIKPEMNAAITEVKQYDRKSLMDIKTTSTPTTTMALVMEATMIMLQEKTDWASIKSLLTDANEFIGKLTAFSDRVASLPEAIVKKVKSAFVNNPEFEPDQPTGKSAAVRPLSRWVKAMITYYDAYAKTAPKRRRYEAEKAKLDSANETLNAKLKDLEEAKTKVAQLKADCDNLQAERTQIAQEIAGMKRRSGKVEEFFTAFAEDEARWKQLAKDQRGGNLTGNILLAAAYIVYLGQFPEKDRAKLTSEWIALIKKRNLDVDTDFDLVKVLVKNFSETQSWINNGLPKDQLSLENAVTVLNSHKWPLIIDPHLFANKWLKNEFRKNGLVCLKTSQSDYLKMLSNAMRLGKPVLIEDVEDYMDLTIDPLLCKNVVEKENEMSVVCIDGKEMKYDKNFMLFMTSKKCNPQWTSKTNVVEFGAGIAGLEEALLDELTAEAIPDNEAQYADVKKQIAERKQTLSELDEKMLTVLSAGPLEQVLDEESNYEALKAAKKTYYEVATKIMDQEKLEQSFWENREKYRKVTSRASAIFSVAMDFAQVYPEYAFSLDNFRTAFTNAISPDTASQSISKLSEKVTKKLCTFIERGMWKSHRIIFAFLVHAKIQIIEGEISEKDWEYFTKPNNELEIEATSSLPNIIPTLISNQSWQMVQKIDQQLSQFSGLVSDLAMNQFKWEEYFAGDMKKLPGEWEQKISSFDKLLLCKIFRPQRLPFEIYEFIKKSQLPVYIENSQAEEAFMESKKTIPIILLQQQFCDPLKLVKNYASKTKCLDRLVTISLGQDQGQQAKRTIQAAQGKGEWIFLENCHLAKTWMKELEVLVEQMQDLKTAIHDDFRLFLTSCSTESIPQSILKNGIKIALEKPEGIKERARAAVSKMGSSKHSDEFQRLLLGLCIFHGVVNEVELNQGKYEFRQEDVEAAAKILKNLLEEHEEIPWDTIASYIGEVQYGERIVNENDKKWIKAIFKAFCGQSTLQPNYASFLCKEYTIPALTTLEEYQKFLAQSPSEFPEMHGSAHHQQPPKAMNEFMEALCKIYPGIYHMEKPAPPPEPSSTLEVIEQLLKELPEPLDISVSYCIQKKIQTGNKELFQAKPLSPLTIVLINEINCYNNLIEKLKLSLEQLQENNETWIDISNKKVPKAWQEITYPTQMPLMNWFQGLIKKVEFIRNWMVEGEPKSFQISALMFPKAFLAALVQLYAREKKVPAEKIELEFTVFKETQACPKDATVIYGLCLKNAVWDNKNGMLDDFNGNKEQRKMPPILVKPMAESKEDYCNKGYLCPVYRSEENEIIMHIDLPTKKSVDYWTLRGVAMLFELNDEQYNNNELIIMCYA
eukprot:TRINITY_DN120355_c3_g1_i1.p1 TRINITY_DN120355_c3_g1~~TRINITY_DN120355_c3_g1_i1.p1  ORF type:complete len:4253 (+),score=509.78 TRINITY_DN120355_c3_g1_i1:57-12761(+)